MDYDLGKALELVNEKLDALLVKAYPEKVNQNQDGGKNNEAKKS